MEAAFYKHSAAHFVTDPQNHTYGRRRRLESAPGVRGSHTRVNHTELQAQPTAVQWSKVSRRPRCRLLPIPWPPTRPRAASCKTECRKMPNNGVLSVRYRLSNEAIEQPWRPTDLSDPPAAKGSTPVGADQRFPVSPARKVTRRPRLTSAPTIPSATGQTFPRRSRRACALSDPGRTPCCAMTEASAPDARPRGTCGG